MIFILLLFSSTVSLSAHVFSCDWNWYWCLFCFCCHIQRTMFGGSVWLYEAVLLVFALYLWSYLVLMYYVLYRVLSYWYLLCSRKANFYVIHRKLNFCILYCILYTWLQVVCKALHVVWWSWFLKLGVVCKKPMVYTRTILILLICINISTSSVEAFDSVVSATVLP